MIIFESSLPENYREDEIKKILSFVTVGKSCQIVSLPGTGKATILKLLAHNRKLLAHHLMENGKNFVFYYLNLLSLTNFSEEEFMKYLSAEITGARVSADTLRAVSEVKNFVNRMANEDKTIVLLFDNFDQYQAKLPKQFFRLLQDLKSVAKYKFSAVFATRRELNELLDEEVLKNYYDFFSGNAIYTNINDSVAFNLIIGQTEKIYKTTFTKDIKDRILKLSNGHAKLTKLLAEKAAVDKTALPSENLIESTLIRSALHELWQALTAQEQKELINISNGIQMPQNEATKQLQKYSLLTPDMKITIPLLEEYAKSLEFEPVREKITFDENTKELKKGENTISDLLSKQEYSLLKYFCHNEGKIIERDEIITVVWPDAQVKEGITNEAIDQMIFRLRRKIEDDPGLPNHITTVKGQGWRFKS